MPILSSNQIEARSRGRVTGFKKSYLRKSPYAGLGKKSRVNGLIKTKSISGHGKRTNKGYRYVNPYARSK